MTGHIHSKQVAIIYRDEFIKNIPVIHILTVAKLSYLNMYDDCVINNETHFFKQLKYLQDLSKFYVARHPLHMQPSIHAHVSKHLIKNEKLSHINLFFF